MTAAERQDAHELLAAALAAHRIGLNVLPPRNDGSKAPDTDEWASRQRTRASEKEIRRWYGNGRTGLGIVCGAISGGLELFDFDCRHTWYAFQLLAKDAGLSGLLARVEDGYLEETPGGGVHLLYYCAKPVNGKLARRPKRPEEQRDQHDRVMTLIETKGEGGYTVTAPSHGRVHETGGAYKLLRGGFDSIVRLTDDEREALHALARSFDELQREKDSEQRRRRGRGTGSRPGDDFNARTTWPEILEPHGWRRLFERSGETYWTRPGKTGGISATTGYAGSDLLYAFTTSTELEAERSYDRFGAYAVLEHDGDLEAAARALVAQGYGEWNVRAASAEGASPEPRTDLGNAERLVRLHGEDLRYVHSWGKWLEWDGQRFALDVSGEIYRRAKATVRAAYAESAQLSDSEERKALAQWATKSESAARIDAMIQLARAEVPVAHEMLDADPWALNVANGTLDLRTGELRPHRRADYLTKLAPVVYDESAKAPTWERFLERILPDGRVRAFVRRAAGYSLSGDTGEQVLFLLWGGGANGKSTFVETLMLAAGDYSMKTPAETLLARREGAIPNDVAALRGARLVAAVETEEGRRLAEVRVKELTGSDTVSARFMRAEWFTFRPVAKLWLATNHRPRVKGTDEAIWRRIRLIPFTVTIPESERDHRLSDRLRAELPGILTWAVAGCLEWQRDGLRPPAAVLAATSSYRAEQDVLGAFLADRCVVTPGGWVASDQLFAAYKRWCEETGEHPVSQRALGLALGERGFTDTRRGAGEARKRGWQGIGLAEDCQDGLQVDA